jgi:hypothetical protein
MFRLARGLSVVPGTPVAQGVSSLEVRWILPGRLEEAVAGWLRGWGPETETREDAYLVEPDLDGLSVKIRGGQALEVKAYRGSPGLLDLRGRARGHLQCWQKWSFPFHPPGRDSDGEAGWRRVRKHRLTSRFSTRGGQIGPAALGDGPQCAVELTEIRVDYRDWWSLGFEATGAANSGGAVLAGLEAAAALVFGQVLPRVAELRLDDSASYAEWLRTGMHHGA